MEHRTKRLARAKHAENDMSRQHNLETHRRSLTEIREIMNSMKTLAYMETRKLGRFIDAQHAVVESIEEVAADLLGFYPESLPETNESSPIIILIGTERGFCGDFNHGLLKHLESSLQAEVENNAQLVVVGRKLFSLLEEDTRVSTAIDGASVVEEIPALLNELVNGLTTLHDTQGSLTVYCLYHGNDDGIIMQKLLPPFQYLLHKPARTSCPPVLNQPADEFLLSLADHYLFAALHEILYTSLMVENRHRVSHLDGAVRHLDEEAADLTRQSNALRQEEITEEIEVILLSAASLGKIPGNRD